MPDKPDNPFKFWEELKRRKVIQVVTLYASSSFVIIEVINNLAEPLNLPTSLLTIVVIVLAIGFPLVIILSWLFDLTSKGVEKTKPLSEIEEGEKSSFSNAWKIATFVSFAVIAILVFMNLTGNLKHLKAGDIQSLVVLPFDNFTGSNESDYYVEGIHSSLISDMGQIGALRVKGVTTSNSFRDKDMSINQIASELNVDAAVEGSISCFGVDSVCIQIRLIRAIGEEQLLWVQDYFVAKSQILNFYNEVTKTISREINIALTPREESLLAEKRTIDPEAYDLFLRGYQHLGDGSEKLLREAQEYLIRAIEIEPDWAILYSSMAQVWMVLQQIGHESPQVAIPKIYEYANKALELDPNSAEAHSLIGMLAYLVEWDWPKAKIEFNEAITLNPGDALSRLFYSQILILLQETDEALKQARIAITHDPINLMVKCQFAAVLLSGYHFEEGLSVIEEVLEVLPEHTLANNQLEKAAFQIGDYERVVKAAKYHIPLKEEAFIEAEKIFKEQGFIPAYSELLRQVEVEMLNDFIIQPPTLACKFHMIGQYDKAMYWIEKGYEIHSPSLVFMVTGFYDFKHLYDNPRFIDIVNKLKLPQPKKVIE